MQRIKKDFIIIFGRVKRTSKFRRLAERYIHSYKKKTKKKPSSFHFQNLYISKKLNNKPYNQETKPCSRIHGYFVHITNCKSVFRENSDRINISAAVTKSFSGKRLINSFVISVQRFKMSRLFRKYYLMSLQSVGMD